MPEPIAIKQWWQSISND